MGLKELDITEQLTPHTVNNQHLLLAVLEGEESRTMGPAHLVSGEGLLTHIWCLLVVSHMVKGQGNFVFLLL